MSSVLMRLDMLGWARVSPLSLGERGGDREKKVGKGDRKKRREGDVK